MYKRGIILLLVLAVILSAFVNASYTYVNSNLNNNFAPGENISGWINVSFSNMPGDALLKNNYGDSITIFEILERMNADYECNPSNCENNYKAVNESTSKIINIIAGESKILSFSVSGMIDKLDLLSFKLNSNADKSCSSPLKIDLLADNTLDWDKKTSTGEFLCYQSYGCFDKLSPLTEYNLNGKPYCEKMYLSSAPSFQLGAWVKKGDGTYTKGMIKMQIYTSSNQLLSECEISSVSSTGGETSCVVNYTLSNPGDYYVCIKGQDGMINYKIKAESESPCGFFDSFKGTYTNDYQIFAKGGKYDKVGIFEYNSTIFSQFSSGSMQSYLTNYIVSRYDNDCSAGCSIPIKLTAGVSQRINISNINLQYTRTEGSLNSNKIYDVELTPSNINSDFLLVDLGKTGFKAPSDYGDYEFKIYINNEEIVNKAIKVIKKPIINSISPSETFAANPTIFYADVSALEGKSIVKYSWDFGDNSKIDTTTNQASHTYTNIGAFSLSITAYDDEGLSASKTFLINVVNPKEIANATISEKKKNFENISSQLNLMDSWEADKIKNKINFTNIQSSLRNLETSYLSASSDESYVKIMSNLLSLKIPKAIYEVEGDSISFISVFDNIDNEKLKFLGAGSYQNKDYESDIKSWFQENMNGDASSKSIVFDYGNNQEVLLTFFKIKLTEKKDTGETFLIVNGESVFKDTATDLTNAKGLKINGNKEVIFYKEGLVNTGDLQAYLSPKFNQLPSIVECNYDNICDDNEDEGCEDCSRNSYSWIIWTAIILLLIILTFFAYKKGWFEFRKKEESKQEDISFPYQRENMGNQNNSGFRSGFKPLN